MVKEGRQGFGNKTPKMELKLSDAVTIARTEKGRKFKAHLKSIGMYPAWENFELKVTSIQGRRIFLWDKETRKYVNLDLSPGEKVSEYLVKKK